MVAEDVGAKKKILLLLADRDETLQEVKKTIQGPSHDYIHYSVSVILSPAFQ